MVSRLIVLLAGLAQAVAMGAALPSPDHVVIVVEENRPPIDFATTPFLKTLSAGGATLSNFYALTHPSQPNYLNLFSGSTQGIIDNATPVNVPFSTPNLASALSSRGFSFAGYSESMPSVGFTGPDTGLYARRHNPWVNWQSAIPGVNQLLPSVNQPFTSFPTNFSLLPKVSIVVPNVMNDMHDGTIAQGDTWLKNNLGAYNTWAQTHNSLLIVTWDEDDGTASNHISTLFSGPMVKAGVNSTRYDTFNLLRTVCDLYSAPAPGAAATVAAISGIWKDPTPPPTTFVKTFRKGASGYTAGHDTFVSPSPATGTHGGASQIVAGGTTASHALVRFDALIGTGASQVPKGAKITSAKLSLKTAAGAADGSKVKFAIHRMLKSWSESSTWNTLVNGVTADGLECFATADASATPGAVGALVTFDVTKSLQTWANGSSNLGWAILTSGTDAWRFDSVEFANVAYRPTLQVSYTLPTVAATTSSMVVAVPEPGGAMIIYAIAMMTQRRRAFRRSTACSTPSV